MSGSTTTQTTIINRALQLLGYKAVSSISQNDRGAKAMNVAYQPVLEAMLRENFWGFSIQRATLAASATQPAFGKGNYFPLPGDFLMIAPPDQNANVGIGAGAIPAGLIPRVPNVGLAYSDWQIEIMPNGTKAIASDDAGPIYLRYVTRNVIEGNFDPNFTEAFAACLAMDTCEQLTQSNAKLQTLEKMHDDAMKKAKQRNAFESMPVLPPVDSWILARM